MREIRRAWVETLNISQRFGHSAMRGMRVVAKRVEKQNVQALQHFQGRFRDFVEVGEIRRVSKAESQHFETSMQHRNGSENDAEQLDWPGDFVDVDLGDGARRAARRKDVMERLADRFNGLPVGVNRNARLLMEVVGANVIESQDMVG